MNIKHVKYLFKTILAGLLLCCCYSPALFAASGSELIVDHVFLKDKISKPGWVCMDMRFPDEYAEGHIPGAVLMPGWISTLYAEDTKRSETLLPRLEKELGTMGISNESHIILYGAVGRTTWNAVMFWALETMGCNSSLAKCTVQFYDSGIEGWQTEGGSLDTTATKTMATTFKAIPEAKRGVKTDELMQVIEGKKKAIIIDVRTAGEYQGTDIRALRGGHMPTAVNIDFFKNFNATSFRMLPLADLKLLYKDIPAESRVITHCQTGQRAAYSYLALRALGYEDVAIYHDGWRVYGSNLNLPVENETWYDFYKINTTMKAVKELKEKM
ncbi:MAG: sulfurtransferase [Desulfobulbaceae bacterium]|nr:sulfurtransferase [Desulfobulbaceae bacterium]